MAEFLIATLFPWNLAACVAVMLGLMAYYTVCSRRGDFDVPNLGTDDEYDHGYDEPEGGAYAAAVADAFHYGTPLPDPEDYDS